jgi:hypothetical protein
MEFIKVTNNIHIKKDEIVRVDWLEEDKKFKIYTKTRINFPSGYPIFVGNDYSEYAISISNEDATLEFIEYIN